MSQPVNKGEKGWENQQQQWKSEFSTQRQKTEGITVGQSLDIIANHEAAGNQKIQVKAPQGKTLDGTEISLRVRDAKAQEDANAKAGPSANPFLKRDLNAGPKKKDLSQLP